MYSYRRMRSLGAAIPSERRADHALLSERIYTVVQSACCRCNRSWEKATLHPFEELASIFIS